MLGHHRQQRGSVRLLSEERKEELLQMIGDRGQQKPVSPICDDDCRTGFAWVAAGDCPTAGRSSRALEPHTKVVAVQHDQNLCGCIRVHSDLIRTSCTKRVLGETNEITVENTDCLQVLRPLRSRLA